MKSFNCEICKTPYPLKFKYDDISFDLIDYLRPYSSSYIVFESLNQMKENCNYKSVHIVTLHENEKIILGRANESDVRINDISVSRSHACLVMSNKKIMLRDLKSKFGTLLLLQKDVDLSANRKLSLQIGRTYFESNYFGTKEAKIKEKNLLALANAKANGTSLGKRLSLRNSCLGKF